MKTSVQRYYIGRYVTVWESDECGNKCKLLIEEGRLRNRKIELGKTLIIELLNGENTGIGAVTKGCNYKRHNSLLFRASGNWYLIERNQDLETLLEDSMGWTDLFD